ncbi:hypothetical protein RIR_jg9828.t1 [Rhizophagus irregularis DAOM 181602=DAOM 197198]|nr:hypothetical protein RIR_jg9828.t1 [Rhizophagus irregularis DAOM 181602=DAOM 197198]
MFPLFLFTCTLILTILTILTTCLFFPFSLFLYSFVQLLCRYRNIYLLILIILILTRFFFYLFVTLCHHILNVVKFSYHNVNMSNTVISYIFPKQFNLKNVFTCREVSHALYYTYMDRRKEIDVSIYIY